MSIEKCLICGRKLDDPSDPVRSINCGGDCLQCMATVGQDPDCIAALAAAEDETITAYAKGMAEGKWEVPSGPVMLTPQKK